MRKMIPMVFTLALCLVPFAAEAGRHPCDRGAGGVSHCAGGKFICNNGTVSGSSRTCGASDYSGSSSAKSSASSKQSRSSAQTTSRRSSRNDGGEYEVSQRFYNGYRETVIERPIR